MSWAHTGEFQYLTKTFLEFVLEKHKKGLVIALDEFQNIRQNDYKL
jgi:superfamily I DNA and RNA helicase